MTNPEPNSHQSTDVTINEDDKPTGSLQSLISFITLGAGLSLLGGGVLIWLMITNKSGLLMLIPIMFVFAMSAGLFWCSRLLRQRSQRAITVYIVTILANWLVVLIMRLAMSQPLLGLTDFGALIVTGAMCFEMYKLKRNGVLV